METLKCERGQDVMVQTDSKDYRQHSSVFKFSCFSWLFPSCWRPQSVPMT